MGTSINHVTNFSTSQTTPTPFRGLFVTQNHTNSQIFVMNESQKGNPRDQAIKLLLRVPITIPLLQSTYGDPNQVTSLNLLVALIILSWYCKQLTHHLEYSRVLRNLWKSFSTKGSSTNSMKLQNRFGFVIFRKTYQKQRNLYGFGLQRGLQKRWAWPKMLKKYITYFMNVPLFENFPHRKIEKCLTKLLEFPRAVMGNPNRFEGQIFDKKSCRGPKYNLDDFSVKQPFFRAFRSTALKSLKGRVLKCFKIQAKMRENSEGVAKKYVTLYRCKVGRGKVNGFQTKLQPLW